MLVTVEAEWESQFFIPWGSIVSHYQAICIIFNFFYFMIIPYLMWSKSPKETSWTLAASESIIMKRHHLTNGLISQQKQVLHLQLSIFWQQLPAIKKYDVSQCHRCRVPCMVQQPCRGGHLGGSPVGHVPPPYGSGLGLTPSTAFYPLLPLPLSTVTIN